jgi:hypothetical protein
MSDLKIHLNNRLHDFFPKVELVDRSLLPGDIIRWVDKDKPNQKAHIKAVSVFVDLLVVGTNQIIKNIDAKKLLPLIVSLYCFVFVQMHNV